MNKLVVVMLGVLCLVVGTAAFGVVQVAEKLSADLHRSAIALDALVARVTAVEEDLANIAADVYAIADDVGAIADSLEPGAEDDDQGGESVGLRMPVASVGTRAPWRIERVRARAARLARRASVARPVPARAAHRPDGAAGPH